MKSLQDVKGLVAKREHAKAPVEQQHPARSVFELVLVLAAIPLALLFAYEFIRLIAWFEFT